MGLIHPARLSLPMRGSFFPGYSTEFGNERSYICDMWLCIPAAKIVRILYESYEKVSYWTILIELYFL